MHLWFQALSRLRIPQFSSLDDVFPSRLIIWRTENFSAARIIPVPNDLAYQKIRHSNDPKKSPRGVHVIYLHLLLHLNNPSNNIFDVILRLNVASTHCCFWISTYYIPHIQRILMWVNSRIQCKVITAAFQFHVLSQGFLRFLWPMHLLPKIRNRYLYSILQKTMLRMPMPIETSSPQTSDKAKPL